MLIAPASAREPTAKQRLRTGSHRRAKHRPRRGLRHCHLRSAGTVRHASASVSSKRRHLPLGGAQRGNRRRNGTLR